MRTLTHLTLTQLWPKKIENGFPKGWQYSDFCEESQKPIYNWPKVKEANFNEQKILLEVQLMSLDPSWQKEKRERGKEKLREMDRHGGTANSSERRHCYAFSVCGKREDQRAKQTLGWPLFVVKYSFVSVVIINYAHIQVHFPTAVPSRCVPGSLYPDTWEAIHRKAAFFCVYHATAVKNDEMCLEAKGERCAVLSNPTTGTQRKQRTTNRLIPHCLDKKGPIYPKEVLPVWVNM